jgi:UDP-N-acetylmuramoyl-L-alanyl-D-glutamate--2,6-diaminopimelate ligase
VPATSLADLAARLGLAPPANSADVTGAAQASPDVQPGDLYIALPGARTHGAAYAAEAAARGAHAILTDSAGADRVADSSAACLPLLVTVDPRALAGPAAALIFGDPSRRLRIAGITGTNGKTTTAHLVDAVLRGLGKATALLGTIHTRIGTEQLPAVRTTPEAAQLQALLATAVERGIEYASMEVSSHALALQRVDGVRFAVGAFTNLSVDHLDFHADLDDYFAAKARLFDGRAEREVVTVDDEAGRALVTPDSVTVSIAEDSSAMWRATDIRRAGHGQRFRLHAPDGTGHDASIGLPGRFNVANGLLAVAIAVTLGAPLPDVVKQLAVAPGVPGRMEHVGGASAPILAVVDYAHAPDGVTQALAALRETTPGRLICVLGCGGDRDTTKRPAMGAAAAAGADLFIATDDNPRSEVPAMIRAAMLSGARSVPGAGEVIEVGDRAAAINRAVELARPTDTVAVLGKGHEQGQEIAGEMTPFDDRRVLADAVARVFG